MNHIYGQNKQSCFVLDCVNDSVASCLMLVNGCMLISSNHTTIGEYCFVSFYIYAIPIVWFFIF